jgi:hypothetical protein
VTEDNWLARANEPAVHRAIREDAYSKVYPFLIEHFASIQNTDWSDAVVGLHIVYGWMPTIPNLEIFSDWSEPRRNALTNALEKTRRGQDVTRGELEIVQSFANNSVVGASKLLHFLSPANNPIWDRRVARVFLSKPHISHSEVNRVAGWVEYKSTLLTWLKSEKVLNAVKELRSLQPALAGVSDLRMVELVLFHGAV